MCECVCPTMCVCGQRFIFFFLFGLFGYSRDGGHKRQNKDCFQCGLLREKQGTHSLSHAHIRRRKKNSMVTSPARSDSGSECEVLIG